MSCENAGYTESVVISVVCKSRTCLQIRQEIFQQYKTVITFWGPVYILQLQRIKLHLIPIYPKQFGGKWDHLERIWMYKRQEDSFWIQAISGKHPKVERQEYLIRIESWNFQHMRITIWFLSFWAVLSVQYRLFCRTTKCLLKQQIISRCQTSDGWKSNAKLKI